MALSLPQYQSRLAGLAQQVTQRATEQAVVPAASKLLASIKNRIIREGKNSAGSAIGQYSSKPAYYTRRQFVKQGVFKPQGKTGKGAKKNGSPRTSMYLAGGYKQLRDIQGREATKKNLEYSGNTFAAYQLQALEGAVLMGFTQQKASRIRQGLEKRLGPVYSATKLEIESYSREAIATTERITRQLLTP